MNPAPEQSSLDIYMKQISDIPLLTVEEEIELAAKIAKGDKMATMCQSLLSINPSAI